MKKIIEKIDKRLIIDIVLVSLLVVILILVIIKNNEMKSRYKNLVKPVTKYTCKMEYPSDEENIIFSNITVLDVGELGQIVDLNKYFVQKYDNNDLYIESKKYYQENLKDVKYEFNDETLEIRQVLKDASTNLSDSKLWYKSYVLGLEKNGYTCVAEY